ncbi:calcium-binding protein [uncultured Spongiibacter sp.]|uniref:beta strand repeat-containing protein n=1 Tax=uncultured Spongiibacter sp. TaxID=870896 RepID=UPI002587B71B|nr:calcium-binding protein [uncultured Spongiibacter sp.]
MKKQGTREQITVDVDTTTVDTLSAELAAAVAPQADLETAPVEGLFDDEKKLEEDVALSEGAIQTEAVEVAAADNGVAAMVLADTNAQSSGGASTGGSAAGGMSTGMWVAAGVGAAAVGYAVADDDDSDGGSKSSDNNNPDPTPETYTVSASGVDVLEGDQGDSNQLTFTLTLDKAPVGESVKVTVVAGAGDVDGASVGQDFKAFAQDVVFAEGETTKIITVDVNGDTDFEADESVKLTITGSQLTTATTVEALIINDETNELKTTLDDDTIVGTSLDDEIQSGTVNGGNGLGASHTLGTADTIDGKEGFDTLKLSDNTGGGGFVGGPSELTLNSASVERLEAKITGGTDTILDMSGSNDYQEIVNTSQAGNTFEVNGLNDDVKFIQQDGASTTIVSYSQNGLQAIDNELDIAMNNANGAQFVFNSAQTVGIDTLNLEVNGPAANPSSIVTSFGNSTIQDVDGLTTVNLSGNGNVAGVGNLAEDATPAIFNDVTTFDASGLEGTLDINLLGDAGAPPLADRNITFTGAQDDTSLVIGQGNNTVNFQGGDDLLVLSSTGFNGNDSVDGGAGNDSLEIHFNDTISAAAGGVLPNGTTPNGLDDASDGVVQAINNATNVENLIVDVWTQTTEDVDLDAALIANFTGFVFDDTFADGGLANVQDADISDVTVDNVRDVNTFTFATDRVDDTKFNAAAGNNTLNISHMGSDASNAFNDNDRIDNVEANGFSQVNIELINTNVDDLTTGVDETGRNQIDDLYVEDGSTTTLTGQTGQVDIEVDQAVASAASAAHNITFDASGLQTSGDRTPGATNPNDFANYFEFYGENVTFFGTQQDDDVLASDGADAINGNGGDDFIVARAGDDVVQGGAGNDRIYAGETSARGVAEGIDKLDGGDGNDTFYFQVADVGGGIDAGLTSADEVSGGAGTDSVELLNAAVDLRDGVFNNWSGVENLTLSDITLFGGATQNLLTINQIANDRGINNITGSSLIDEIIVGEGFVNDLLIDLSDGGDDILNGGAGTATAAKGAITVFSTASEIDQFDDLVFGDSKSDTVQLEADNGNANLDGVRSAEFVKLQSSVAGRDVDVDITDNAVVNSLSAGVNTLTVDGSDMQNALDAFGNIVDSADITLDASALTSAKSITVIGGEGNDLFMTGSANDVINGGAGNDEINAGGGADILSGGDGNDTFVYDELGDSAGVTIDTIMGFVSAGLTDQIAVDDAMFSSVVAITGHAFGGNQASFGAAQGATTDGDGIIDYVFQSDTSTLWVDANDDGTLNANDLQIVLDGVTAIQANDVVVV